jgi:hypothetical protein
LARDTLAVRCDDGKRASQTVPLWPPYSCGRAYGHAARPPKEDKEEEEEEEEEDEEDEENDDDAEEAESKGWRMEGGAAGCVTSSSP